MCFGSLALIEVISMIAGIVAAIISAWYGAGYWALVLMELVTTATAAVGVWLACAWGPGLYARYSDIRSMLAFGGNLTCFNFLNFFARSIDKILIGKFWGAGQLGLYSKAYQLLLMPLRRITIPISAVAIPALSRLQNDHIQYQRYYYRAIRMIAFITMPLVVTLAALSDEVIRIILGEQWIDAANIFKVLTFAAVFQPVVSTTGWVYISLGNTKRMLYWGLISVPVIVLSFLVGLPWGPIGVAVSYTISSIFILMIPSLLFAFRHTPVSLVGFLKTISCPLTISMIIYFAVDLTRRYFNLYSSIQVVLYSCVAGLFVFVLSLIFWPRARDEVLSLIRVMRLLKSQRSVV
jgi:PST family polysaccharide transporter